MKTVENISDEKQLNEILEKENRLRKEIFYIYCKVKEAFIKAEELTEEMRFFAAPTLEHRDALEHIMRYLDMTTDGRQVSDNAIKELESAKGHEIRAYFDVVDYFSILIRDEMNNTLQKLSNRKIRKNWKDYARVKKMLYEISEEIADVRERKKNDIEAVELYENKLKEILDEYKIFEEEVIPKLND